MEEPTVSPNPTVSPSPTATPAPTVAPTVVPTLPRTGDGSHPALMLLMLTLSAMALLLATRRARRGC